MNTALPKPAKLIKKTGYHHGNLRVAIINAVAQLIGEKNGLNFRLKEVAKLVGTSQPAIYKHFSGKDAVLVETAVEGYNLQKQFRDHALALTDGSPLSMILAMGYAYVYFSRTHPGYFLLMKSLETREILSSPRYIRGRDEAVNLISSLIQQCKDNESFIDVDPDLALTSLQSTAYGLAHLYVTGQIELTAGNHVDDRELPGKILAQNMGSMLSAKGKREILKIQKNLFANLDNGFQGVDS